jgi:hypothetical protein
MFGVYQGLRMFPSLVNCWGLRNVSRLDEDSSLQLFSMHFSLSESCGFVTMAIYSGFTHETW